MRIGFAYILVTLLYASALAQPANNNCASATTLTIGSSLSCGQTTQNATTQSGECITSYAGASEESVWYRVDATNDSLVLNFVVTNTDDCPPHIRVYGPFANGAGCLPACGTAIYSGLQNGDPGSHILLTGLATTGNNDYLIQIQGNSCGGPNDGWSEFCISVANPASNSTASNATLIDECGTAFTNSTNGGYYNQGTSTGFNNLDGNNTTTCGTCSETGDDTPFVVNNVSWSTFCSLTTGTWQVTVNGISGCTLASPNQGIQASVFTGTSSALVNQGNSASPIPPGSSYASPVLTVNSGECAFLMIDGFAGDACNYSVTLTNLSGGCIILPLGLLSFSATPNGDFTQLEWTVASEIDNKAFILERSYDGTNFTDFAVIPSIGNHSTNYTYSYEDRLNSNSMVYYRLSAVNIEGERFIQAITFAYGNVAEMKDEMIVYPNPSSGDFQISLHNNFADYVGYIQIYSSTGFLLNELTVQVNHGNNTFLLDLNDWSEGMYIVKFRGIDQVYSSRIVLRK